MPPSPAAFLECPKCHSIVDFSKPAKDESPVICGKCGHDFGTYKNVKDAANRAIQSGGMLPPNQTKH